MHYSYAICAKSQHLVVSSVHPNIYKVYNEVVFNCIKKITGRFHKRAMFMGRFLLISDGTAISYVISHQFLGLTIVRNVTWKPRIQALKT